MAAQLIALDWGTSSFRAYLVASDGSIIDSRASPQGILAVPAGGFEAAFEQHVAGWDAGLPVLASGMITSRQGWREVPYAAAPAGLPELAARLTRFRTGRGRTIAFVPGVSCRDANGVPDVIRGEETQIVGIAGAGSSGVYVTRGTHCKWVAVEDGRIARFATFMTGELFAVLKQHSILGRLMTSAPATGEGFSRGVAAGLECGTGGGLMHALFGVRSLGLFGDIAEDQLEPYLSGLLLGAEIAAARKLFPLGPAGLTVVGAPALAEPFGVALAQAGIGFRTGPDDAAVRGLRAIGTFAGVIA